MRTYFVRVRSNSTNLAVLDGGLTSGEYQLQIRLNQVDEKPGSVVRNAEIRYASTAIQVQGLPAHSPLLGESAEVGDAEIFSGQDLGNLLDTDRNTISVAGALGAADGSDVDTYNFNLDYATTTFGPSIQSIGGVNDGQKTWSTVFDLDYSDGLTRGDTTLVVFDGETDIPILVGFDSNIEDDQDGDRANLLAGSFGQLDPFIGPVQMPAGNPGQITPYSVSVTSNGAYSVRQLDQTFLDNCDQYADATRNRSHRPNASSRITSALRVTHPMARQCLPTNQNTTNPTGLLFPNMSARRCWRSTWNRMIWAMCHCSFPPTTRCELVNPFVDATAGGGLINFIQDDLDTDYQQHQPDP